MDDKLKLLVQQLAQRIYDEKGEITASGLVAAARPKDEPARAAFEWDNKKCGDEHRLNQARRYLRIIVVNTPEPEPLAHIPVSISVRQDGDREGTYKPLSIVVQDLDEFTRALSEARQRVSAAQRAVRQLQAAAEKSDRPERAVMVAQVSRALDILEQAVVNIH